MRVWPKHWHADVWVCSIRDHVAPAEFAKQIRPEDELLGVTLPDGRRLARCLRCDGWIMHAEPVGAALRYDVLPPIQQLTKPRRDSELSDAIFMRFIALNKALHASLFSLSAAVLLTVKLNLGFLKNWAETLLRFLNSLVAQSGQAGSHSWATRELDKILRLKGTEINGLLAVALLYAVMEWCEAVGLWKEKRWGEYLTVIATAGFLPLEVHELLKNVTTFKVIAIVINVVLLVWLISKKRLFGLRGGESALKHNTDWQEILETIPTRMVRSPKL